jgi:hypothetical protein
VPAATFGKEASSHPSGQLKENSFSTLYEALSLKVYAK